MQTMLKRKQLHCGDLGRRKAVKSPCPGGGLPRTCMCLMQLLVISPSSVVCESKWAIQSLSTLQGELSPRPLLNGLVGRGPYWIRNPIPCGWQRHGATGGEGVRVRVCLTLGEVTFLSHPARSPTRAKHVIISVLGDAEATWRPLQLLMVDWHQGQGRVTVPRDALSLSGGDPVQAGAVQFSLGVVAHSGVEKSQDRQDGGPFHIRCCWGGKCCLNLSRTGSSSGQVHRVMGKKPKGADFVQGQLVEAVGGLRGALLRIVADDGF